MDKDKVIKTLEDLLFELECAYKGGYRPITEEVDHEAIRFAINELKNKNLN